MKKEDAGAKTIMLEKIKGYIQDTGRGLGHLRGYL
jgi:hypothetical protein